MITTFYSYKGGVGRSMALANVASALSQVGLRVLMLDFDLEAPGLEQFFEIDVEEVRRNAGLLDLLLTYKRTVSMAGAESRALEDIGRFVVDVHPSLPSGRLHLLPAGRRHPKERLEEYARNLRSFDWQDFYFEWQGERFFEWLRRSLVPEPYDVVLVDSRTGVTEMGGICGYQLADILVMFCAANQQNLGGTANMLRDFRSPAVRAMRQERALQIVVVPARIEQRDPNLEEAFFGRFDAAFADEYPAALREAGLGARELSIPYEPAYAFEERVVTDPDRVKDVTTIRRAFHRLAHAMSLLADPGTPIAQAEPRLADVAGRPRSRASARGSSAPAPVPSPPAPTPSAPLAYNVASRYADYDAYLDASSADAQSVESIAAGLRDAGVRLFRGDERPEAGAEFESVVGEALFHSRALLVCVGPSGLSDLRRGVVERASTAAGRTRALRIVPVLLPGSSPESLDGTPLAAWVRVDLRKGLDESTLQELSNSLTAATVTPGKVETPTRCPFPGPKAFEETDAPYFFGRERLVAAAVARLSERRAVALAGPSACGKSSMVAAGIVPALRAGAGPAGAWIVATIRIDAHPAAELADVLGGLTGEAPEEPSRDAAALDLLLRRAIAAEPGRRILIFLDQIEDLITRCDDGAEREAFGALVAGWLASPPEGAAVVVATREDALAALEATAGLGRAIQAVRIDVPPLTETEFREAIEKPGQRAGLAFEPGLVDRLVANVVDEPGALPFLQEMLRGLWEARRGGWLTNAAYDAAGGFRLFVTARADALLASLPSEAHGTARSLLLRLVQTSGGGGPAARRRTTLGQLLAVGDERGTESSRRKILDDLVDGRVVVSRLVEGEPTFELAHDALARWWTRLQVWLNEDREWLEWRSRFDAALASWRQGGEDESLLLRGPALQDAKSRGASRGGELTADEAAFLARSERRAAKLQRRKFAAMATLGLLFWAGVGTVAYRGYKRYQANEERANLADLEAKAAWARFTEAEKSLKELASNLEALRKSADDCVANTAAERERRLEAEKNYVEAQNSLDELRKRAIVDRDRMLKNLPFRK